MDHTHSSNDTLLNVTQTPSLVPGRHPVIYVYAGLTAAAACFGTIGNVMVIGR